jgi:predicted GTPase
MNGTQITSVSSIMSPNNNESAQDNRTRNLPATQPTGVNLRVRTQPLNILLVGESGLGKTTFIDTLFGIPNSLGGKIRARTGPEWKEKNSCKTKGTRCFITTNQ